METFMETSRAGGETPFYTKVFVRFRQEIYMGGEEAWRPELDVGLVFLAASSFVAMGLFKRTPYLEVGLICLIRKTNKPILAGSPSTRNPLQENCKALFA